MRVEWKSVKNQDKFFVDALNALEGRCGRGPFEIDPVPDQASRNLSPGKIVSIHGKYGIVGINAKFLVPS